jgi:RNA polymerase sigma-70 factor (ECF subfamily)
MRVHGVGLPQADETLLRGLFDNHAGALLQHVLPLAGGDRGRAEDIVQETLIRAWRHPEAMGPERGPIRPWLYAVARNLAIDATRARAARPREVSDAPLALVESPDEELDHAVDSWVMSEALDSLSPQHREVLVEVYYRGRSVAEAAEVLGVPAGTVKSRTYYALRALKLTLEERGLTP